jgi:hypothetical protein
MSDPRFVRPGELRLAEPEPHPAQYRPLDRVLRRYGWRLTQAWRGLRTYANPAHPGHQLSLDVGEYLIDPPPDYLIDLEAETSLVWSHHVVDPSCQVRSIGHVAGGLILVMDGRVETSGEARRMVTAVASHAEMLAEATRAIAHHLDRFHGGSPGWRTWWRAWLASWRRPTPPR